MTKCNACIFSIYETHCCLDSVGCNGSINLYHIDGLGGGRRILICLNNECNE